LPARAAAIDGSAWSAFGPPLSNSPIVSSSTSRRQSSVAYSKPYRRAASSTASVLRPAMPTSFG